MNLQHGVQVLFRKDRSRFHTYTIRFQILDSALCKQKFRNSITSKTVPVATAKKKALQENKDFTMLSVLQEKCILTALDDGTCNF